MHLFIKDSFYKFNKNISFKPFKPPTLDQLETVLNIFNSDLFILMFPLKNYSDAANTLPSRY